MSKSKSTGSTSTTSTTRSTGSTGATAARRLERSKRDDLAFHAQRLARVEDFAKSPDEHGGIRRWSRLWQDTLRAERLRKSIDYRRLGYTRREVDRLVRSVQRRKELLLRCANVKPTAGESCVKCSTGSTKSRPRSRSRAHSCSRKRKLRPAEDENDDRVPLRSTLGSLVGGIAAFGVGAAAAATGLALATAPRRRRHHRYHHSPVRPMHPLRPMHPVHPMHPMHRPLGPFHHAYLRRAHSPHIM